MYTLEYFPLNVTNGYTYIVTIGKLKQRQIKNVHNFGHSRTNEGSSMTPTLNPISYKSLILLLAEVHGNRTHLPARHRYAGFEDQEAHQDPGTSVEDNLLFKGTIVNAQVVD